MRYPKDKKNRNKRQERRTQLGHCAVCSSAPPTSMVAVHGMEKWTIRTQGKNKHSFASGPPKKRSAVSG